MSFADSIFEYIFVKWEIYAVFIIIMIAFVIFVIYYEISHLRSSFKVANDVVEVIKRYEDSAIDDLSYSEWLKTPRNDFGGMTPLDMIINGRKDVLLWFFDSMVE